MENPPKNSENNSEQSKQDQTTKQQAGSRQVNDQANTAASDKASSAQGATAKDTTKDTNKDSAKDSVQSTTKSSAKTSASSEANSQQKMANQKQSASIDDKSSGKTANTKPTPEKKSGGSKFATLMSLVALGVGGTSMYMQVQPNAKIPFLSDKLAQLSSSEQQNTAADAGSGNIAELESKLAQFDSRLASLSQNQSTSSDNQQLNQLEQQIQHLQQQIAQSQQSDSTNQANQQDDSAGNLAQLEASQQQLSQKLEQVLSENQQLKQSLSQLQQKQTALSGSVNTVATQLPQVQDADIWALRDIELTLKQADRRLNNVNDVETVLPLMQDALQQMINLGRPNLLSASNALKQDIEKLSQLEVPAKGDILKEINRLARSAKSLPLIGERVSEQEQSQTEQSATDKVADAGAGFLSSITDMIEIKKDGQAIRPIVSNELRELARQRTQLILESANAAYINADFSLFEQRLQTAKDWVNQHFDVEADVTRQWLTQLNQLEQKIPSNELPDISPSLNAVKQALAVGG